MGFRWFIDNLGSLIKAAGVLVILGIGFYYIITGIIERKGTAKILLGVILALFAGGILLSGYDDLNSANLMGDTLWDNLRQMFSSNPAP